VKARSVDQSKRFTCDFRTDAAEAGDKYKFATISALHKRFAFVHDALLPHIVSRSFCPMPVFCISAAKNLCFYKDRLAKYLK
jgi:hypothetical protein